MLTVIDPEGMMLGVPAWMAMPQAACFRLTDKAEISVHALLSLADLLELLGKSGQSHVEIKRTGLLAGSRDPMPL